VLVEVHSLVQHANDFDLIVLRDEEEDVTANREPPIAGPNIIASATFLGIMRNGFDSSL
jgi:hypothetical protein